MINSNDTLTNYQKYLLNYSLSSNKTLSNILESTSSEEGSILLLNNHHIFNSDSFNLNLLK